MHVTPSRLCPPPRPVQLWARTNMSAAIAPQRLLIYQLLAGQVREACGAAGQHGQSQQERGSLRWRGPELRGSLGTWQFEGAA